MFQAATVFAGDAYCEVGDAAQEVGGAIQWVDDPQVVFAFAATFMQAGFLTQDA